MDDEPGVMSLADDEARKRVATDLDKTLFVEAGAGTGKTHALISRIVELLLTGRARLGELAAITFTEASAVELRTRLGARLAELALEHPDDERVHDALDDLDDAVVTTIHGFAQRILAENPLPAGLPLRIRVLDDFAADVDHERRFAALLDELFDGPGADQVAAALALGISPRHIGDLARQVDEAWDVHARRVDGVDLSDDERARSFVAARVLAHGDDVRAALNEVLGIAGACTEASDALAMRIASLAPFLAICPDAEGWLATLRWLALLPPLRPGGKGAKRNWSVPIAEVRSVVAAYESAREAAIASAADGLVGWLLLRLSRSAAEAAVARRQAGTLRYHDLLVIARDLLARDHEVRRAVQQRFAHVLVDEFQDTDELQLEILYLVAGTEDGQLRDGRLFFVGDPKQAIYRFRGADVALYERVRREVATAGATRLVTNFRSVPGVLEWVNSTFGRLAESLPSTSEWTELVASRAPLGPAAVTVLGGPRDKVATRLHRRHEAQEVASAITAAITDRWPVLDGESVRCARWGDVALLVPRRTGLDELEAALDARDVPYRVKSSTLVYGSSEVRDLLACLRAVDAPGDERAIVAALRTPQLACGDDELLEFRRAGGQWRIDVAPPDGFAAHPVARSLGELRRLHEARHDLGVVGTLEAIVEDWRVLQLATPLRRRDEAWRRLMYVVDQARAFVAAGGSSIAELLAWADHQARRNVRVLDPATGDDDAVQIMTVHGAKGLEFPIVVLAELGAGLPVHRGARVLLGPGGQVEAHVVGAVATSGFAELAEEERSSDLAEQVRLCYVAATRARDHLVVSLRHTPTRGSTPTLAELLWAASREQTAALARPDTTTWGVGTAPSRSVDAPAATHRLTHDGASPPPGPITAQTTGLKESYAGWIARREALLARACRPGSVAAGALAPAEPSALSPLQPAGSGSIAPTRIWGDAGLSDDGDDPLLAWRARRAATDLGRAVHGVLQRVELGSGEDLDEIAAVEASVHRCVDRVDEIRGLARSALASPVVRAAVASGMTYREIPIGMPVGDGVLEGVVDLCFVDEGGIVVVDYKTDALGGPDEVPTAAHRYRLQLGAYALVLATVLGRPVHRCVLVFLAPPDGAVEHELDDVAGAIEEARRATIERVGGDPLRVFDVY